MHDLHLAKEIFDAVIECAKKNKLRQVDKIKIGLGRIEEHHETVEPENLKFNFRIFAKDSIAKNARFLVRKIRGPHWCLEEIEGN